MYVCVYVCAHRVCCVGGVCMRGVCAHVWGGRVCVGGVHACGVCACVSVAEGPPF